MDIAATIRNEADLVGLARATSAAAAGLVLDGSRAGGAAGLRDGQRRDMGDIENGMQTG